MSPEQTGRVNRFIDTRSDLYSLGVTFYEMLTGVLPFVASDLLEWIHCHVARQPAPLQTIRQDIPRQLEAIVLKLLAKTAEDRYQTASGVENDLQRCLASWTATGNMATFPIAANDTGEGLRVADSLYGRERDIANILSAFKRVAAEGETEIVLLSGPAGVGKSSIVKELQRALLATPALIAAGKSDQYKLDIPYPTMAHAFQGLVRRILGLETTELDRWRRQLLEALGPNGQLMINLVPELAVIIGDQPPPPDLPPQEAQNRFHIVFRRFLGVFAQPSHPLALFIDDLQWLDTATIELIERLVSESDIRHLLLIGAYRDDEIQADHRLSQALQAMRAANLRLLEIHVAPLTRGEVTMLTADTLRTAPTVVRPLAQLIFNKTKGNPFFAVQFLKALKEEGLLAFDGETAAWRWDLDRINAKSITDNVADLLAGKLTRLPVRTLAAVKHLACLGNGARLTTLTLVEGQSERQTGDALDEAVRAGFLLLVEGGYIFSHDRMQEAAYMLIPEVDRAATHLHIGRALVSRMSAAGIQEHLFEVLDQFGRGVELMASSEERLQIARLYLEAGTRAKTSTAYASALKYFRDGRTLLEPHNWELQYELAFRLELQQAECEFLTGDQAAAVERLSTLASHTQNLVDGGSVAHLRISLYTLSDPNRAVDIGIAFLRQVGIDWPAHPSEQFLKDQVEAMNQLLAGRAVERLIDLPVMSDPVWLTAMHVLAALILPAMITDKNLESIVLVRMANISLQHGNCDASSYAYSEINAVLGLRFGDYKTGIAFGLLGLRLVDERAMERFKARVYCCFSTYGLPWTKHLPGCLELNRRAVDMAYAAGDLVFVSAAETSVVHNLWISGAALPVVQQEAEQWLALARKAGFDAAIDGAMSMLQLVHELRGVRSVGGSAIADKDAFERYLAEGGAAVEISRAFYWQYQLQSRYLTQDIDVALSAALHAGDALTVHRSVLDVAEYHFYAALVRAAACDAQLADGPKQHRQMLELHYRRICEWAENCRENFACQAALIGAEIARLDDRHRDAERLYGEAITFAQEYGFVQNEAIANERAANFLIARGAEDRAKAFLVAAVSSYKRWGAEGKVRQMSEHYPQLSEAAAAESRSIAVPDQIKHLDLAAVIKMSQAVSSEIDFDRLVERLMVNVVEHAGAVRGLMLLPRDGAMLIAAEAVSRHGAVGVNTRHLQHVARQLPESIVNYVMRSQETVMLDDALQANPYAEDPYVVQARPRSVLCMPLLKQQQLVGILYVENGLLPSVFTPDRLIVIQILASQAAISIENAKLFADLKDAREQARRAEEQTQQLFDLIPTLAWRVTPRGVVDAINKTWTDYTGISSEQAAQGEWLRAYPGVEGQNGLNQYGLIFAKGVAGTVETLLRRHDGKVRWFLHRVAPLYDSRGEIVCWHGTATDIDDLKRAEALISAEKNLLQMNTDLHTLTEIFEFLVASIEKQIDGSCASLLLWDPGTRRVSHLAVSSLPATFTRALEEARDPLAMPFDIGANAGQSVFVSDIATAPAWHELRTLAQNEDLKVCWSTPIVSAAGATLGVVATYVREGREITHREINVCEQFAHLASIILERKRGEDALKTMNQQLLDSLDEKDSLLKEVHHRVKNNLQLISSMLNLQASRITDKSVAELFSESRNRVRSMALVHENLYRAGNFSKISMAEHVETLSASLARAYGLNREGVELVTQVEDILLDLDVAISVGLIINELTSNALKHAFPDGRTGSVRVELTRVGAERCVLTVRDDGVGFPIGIDFNNGASMGLQLVHDLAEQLHGTVTVANDGGTAFSVSFLTEDHAEAPS